MMHIDVHVGRQMNVQLTCHFLMPQHGRFLEEKVSLDRARFNLKRKMSCCCHYLDYHGHRFYKSVISYSLNSAGKQDDQIKFMFRSSPLKPFKRRHVVCLPVFSQSWTPLGLQRPHQIIIQVLYIEFLDNAVEQAQIKSNFSAGLYHYAGLPNVIGATDCTHMHQSNFFYSLTKQYASFNVCYKLQPVKCLCLITLWIHF